MPTYTKEEIIVNLICNYRGIVLELNRENDCPFDLQIDIDLINDTVDKLNLNKELKINA